MKLDIPALKIKPLGYTAKELYHILKTKMPCRECKLDRPYKRLTPMFNGFMNGKIINTFLCNKCYEKRLDNLRNLK